jgi:hypothetical protein
MTRRGLNLVSLPASLNLYVYIPGTQGKGAGRHGDRVRPCAIVVVSLVLLVLSVYPSVLVLVYYSWLVGRGFGRWDLGSGGRFVSSSR